jgi:hypothetical protein
LIQSTDEKTTSNAPWRGSTIDWSHAVTADTLNKGNVLSPDPTYVQSLYLLPEWHFSDLFVARGRLALDLELTNADDTTNYHEIVVSDGLVDLATTGWTEPNSGIKIGGGLRFQLPFSKASRYQTLQLGVAPAVSLSRQFNVLDGLTVGVHGSYAHLFHSSAVPKIDSNPLPACADRTDATCALLAYGSLASVENSLSGGPSLSLAYGRFTLSGSLDWVRGFTNTLVAYQVPVAVGSASVGGQPAFPRDITRFIASLTVQATDELAVGLNTFTFSPEFAPDASRYSPFYNHYTLASIDFAVDVETLAHRFYR